MSAWTIGYSAWRVEKEDAKGRMAVAFIWRQVLRLRCLAPINDLQRRLLPAALPRGDKSSICKTLSPYQNEDIHRADLSEKDIRSGMLIIFAFETICVGSSPAARCICRS